MQLCDKMPLIYRTIQPNKMASATLTVTVWPEILVGNLFWRIGGFESNPPIFHPPKTSQCDVIIIAKS